MLRDITIGQYYQTDSILHRLDGRVKIVGTGAFILALFMSANFIGYAFAFVFLFLCIALSRVPVLFLLRGMKAVAFLLLLTVICNMLWTTGDVVWQFYFIKITAQGLKSAGMMALRLSFLIVGSSMMTLTTTPNNITDSLENLLNPLKKIRIPVHEMSMMMSIALRFIPILMEETDKIIKAQTARGADFESGNLIKRAKSMLPIFIPLFISAFHRAGDLATAMEARCYRGGDGRTKMKPLSYHRRDFIAYGIFMLFLAGMFVTRRFGV